jgi:predicted Zn-ribbon and HTH transcriptional regulator
MRFIPVNLSCVLLGHFDDLEAVDTVLRHLARRTCSNCSFVKPTDVAPNESNCPRYGYHHQVTPGTFGVELTEISDKYKFCMYMIGLTMEHKTAELLYVPPRPLSCSYTITQHHLPNHRLLNVPGRHHTHQDRPQNLCPGS